MTNPTNPFNWQMPTASDLVTDLPADFETFGQAVATSMADLLGGTTGQVLSKASNTDMDFTWTAIDPLVILDAKGDLISATAADTPARLAVGTNGQVLTADSTAATGLAWATASSGSANVAGKNGVLNSNFSVWQRGTSIAQAASATYTADRWNAFRTGSVTGATISRQATNDTTNLPNIQYAARVQRDSGNTSTAKMFFSNSFESVNSTQYAGKTVAVSFYARAGANFSSASSALGLTFYYGTGTDQQSNTGYTGATSVASTTATLTTTWQRFTATGTVATSATEVSLEFSYTPVGTAGANDYYEITGVQLEIAGSASAYSPNTSTYAAELAACQRYYFQDPVAMISIGYSTNTYLCFDRYYHPVQMRTTPTITQTGAVAFSSNTSATTFSIDGSGSNSLGTSIYFTTGASNGLTYLYRPVQWSAEL